MNPKNVILITTKQLTGGSVYEHKIYKSLKDNFNTTLFELDPKQPRWLPGRKIRYISQVLALKNNDADTIITNAAGVKAFTRFKTNTKNICVFHHLELAGGKNYFVSKVLNKYLLKKITNFDRVVTVSEYWKKYLCSFMDEDKIVVIHSSYDVELIKSIAVSFDRIAFKKKYSIPLDKTIIYGGNSVINKGIQKLVSMIDPDKYHIITSGRKNIDCGNQHLLLNYEEYIKLLLVSEITILLSEFIEGWNGCAHESLLCGTPVIGSDVGGLGEQLKKSNQFIYNSDEPIEKLIETALTDKKRIKQGQLFAEKYDLKYFSSEWNKLVSET